MTDPRKPIQTVRELKIQHFTVLLGEKNRGEFVKGTIDRSTIYAKMSLLIDFTFLSD